jgi:hypothetical protein
MNSVHNWWKRNVVLNSLSLKKILHFPFYQHDTSIQNLLVLYILLYGFEVLTVVRIHNAVWVRTPRSQVHGCESSGGAFWVCLYRQSQDGGIIS